MAESKTIDRRIARTRRALGTALIELMSETGHDKISIRSLTKRADVGYATFYRHYRSRDELLTGYLRSILLDMAKELEAEKSRREQYVAVYKLLEQYRDAVLIGLSLPRDHQAMRPVWQLITDALTDHYEARDEAVIPLQVSVNHIIRSSAELIRWWLTDGNDYSPEQMAKMQYDLIVAVAEQAAVVPRVAEDKSNPGSQRDRQINAADAKPRMPS